jgi:hypothetical protein
MSILAFWLPVEGRVSELAPPNTNSTPWFALCAPGLTHAPGKAVACAKFWRLDAVNVAGLVASNPEIAVPAGSVGVPPMTVKGTVQDVDPKSK